MRALSAAELLGVWERGLAQTPAQRALTLLAAACPETSPDVLAEWSVGQRDARLLTLREWAFGPRLAGLATCPSCGKRLELSFDVADVRSCSVSTVEGDGEADPLYLCVADYEVRFRLPNSLELAEMADRVDDTETRRVLLQRCLLAARQNGQEVSGEQIPSEVLDMVVERMAQADPQADLQLSLCCPACNHEWQLAFDIVSFFWSEINAWAHRILHEVHTLASAYGWREADILAMGPWRRQLYLEMLGG